MIITRSLVVEHSLTRMESLGMDIEIQTFRSDFETDFLDLVLNVAFSSAKFPNLDFKQSRAYVEDFQGRRAREKTQESGIRVSIKDQ